MPGWWGWGSGAHSEHDSPGWGYGVDPLATCTGAWTHPQNHKKRKKKERKGKVVLTLVFVTLGHKKRPCSPSPRQCPWGGWQKEDGLRQRQVRAALGVGVD